MAPRGVEKAFRGLDAGEHGRGGVMRDGRAQRPGAAADVEPAPARREAEPGKKARRHAPAPAADVALVGVAALPGVGHGSRIHAPWWTAQPNFRMHAGLT